MDPNFLFYQLSKLKGETKRTQPSTEVSNLDKHAQDPQVLILGALKGAQCFSNSLESPTFLGITS